jgi:ABC-type antimicrobial peptide transport system permease subunit
MSKKLSGKVCIISGTGGGMGRAAALVFARDYRIAIQWWVFAGAGLLSFVIATVSFQAIKAAIANPVKSLRTE